jgi:hypothetical protein
MAMASIATLSFTNLKNDAKKTRDFWRLQGIRGPHAKNRGSTSTQLQHRGVLGAICNHLQADVHKNH